MRYRWRYEGPPCRLPKSRPCNVSLIQGDVLCLKFIHSILVSSTNFHFCFNLGVGLGKSYEQNPTDLELNPTRSRFEALGEGCGTCRRCGVAAD